MATLLYYDIFDLPLTLLEIYKLMINPCRVNKITTKVSAIKIDEIQRKLELLEKSGFVSEKNGFYFLSGREKLYDLRIARDKIAADKWKKLVRLAKWFTAVPYLKGIFASGSMAVNNTDEKSDFDILVVAESSRLYTCRIFLSLVASIFGARRKRFEKIAPDKFCFNHYITDNSLRIKHESIFNAHTYASLKPVLIGQDLFDKFYIANIWIKKFVYNFEPAYDFVERKANRIKILDGIRKAGEFILDSRVGNWTENIFKWYQQRRIRNNPATYESGGRVIFNDNELEFHPHSFEKAVIEKYNDGLKRLSIVPYMEEKDSGLTPYINIDLPSA